MIWTALILGFAGSLHCIGMCSPLAALVSSSRSMPKRIIYNMGRIVSYATLGGVAGAFGSLMQFSQLQYWLALGFGILLVVFGIGGKSFRIPFLTPLLLRLISKIKALFSFFLTKKNSASILFLGILNGLIPCGLTYIAASYCILLPSAVDGVLFMTIFGLGTLPAMIGSPWVISRLAGYFSLNSKKVITIAVIILGCSVIARAALTNYSSGKKEMSPASICK